MNRSVTLKRISKQLANLTNEELQKLLEFVEQLSEKDRRCLKYFGLWSDRADLEDSLVWVRQLRDAQRSP